MNRFAYPYVTGYDGNRLKCQLRHKVQENDETIYVFLMEATGDTYSIKKADGEWVFVDGNSHLDHWIQELGTYVDENNV